MLTAQWRPKQSATQPTSSAKDPPAPLIQIAILAAVPAISAMPIPSAKKLSVQLPLIIVHQTTNVMQPPEDAKGFDVMQQMRPQSATLQPNSAIYHLGNAFAFIALLIPIAGVTRFAALSSKNAYVLHAHSTPIAVET